jgi:glycosyltransferase involved in cell wall biosynthesis
MKPHLLYLANIRLPTEKAHGLQIMHNCEAFAEAGARVSLWVARRRNTPALRGVHDVYAHYDVQPAFSVRRLPCLDLLWLNAGGLAGRALFGVQAFTFALAAVLAACFTRADVLYSRDAFVLAALALVLPRRPRAYEAHSLAQGRIGRAIQRFVVRRARVFATTQHLASDLIALGAHPAHTHVAPDGIRRARFAHPPTREQARHANGWDEAAFVVGYIGRLHTMMLDKGVGDLVDALAQAGGCTLLLVGGPDAQAEALRARWRALGQPDARFWYAGQVPAAKVPAYLAACDVCAMPFPFNPHFAYHASPIKLFEYMASGAAVVASDLPSTREIVTDGEDALLYPPSDVDALAAAITRLREDAALRRRLGDTARARVFARYTWDARARAILAALTGAV